MENTIVQELRDRAQARMKQVSQAYQKKCAEIADAREYRKMSRKTSAHAWGLHGGYGRMA